MTEELQLRKSFWTEEDFEELNWHDCTIYGIAFQSKVSNFTLDIDYICEWIKPEPNETSFKFQVAPAILIFENVYNLEIGIDSFDLEVQIDNIIRENPQQPPNVSFVGKKLDYLWTIECHQGSICFHSIGFKMNIKSIPQLNQTQTYHRHF
jgi:hypothetical protein